MCRGEVGGCVAEEGGGWGGGGGGVNSSPSALARRCTFFRLRLCSGSGASGDLEKGPRSNFTSPEGFRFPATGGSNICLGLR